MGDETTGTSAADRLGTLEDTGGGWQLRFDRHLRAAPATVWRAFAEPDLVAKWFPSTIEGDLVVGATLRFDLEGHDAEPFDGTVLEADEPRLLVFRWAGDVLRFELAEAGGGTALTMSVLLDERGKATRDGAGWHESLDRLTGLWAGGADGFVAQTWSEVQPVYAERFGPEASTIGPPDTAG